MENDAVQRFVSRFTQIAEHEKRTLDVDPERDGVQLSEAAVQAYKELDILEQVEVSGRLDPKSHSRLMSAVFPPPIRGAGSVSIGRSLEVRPRAYGRELAAQMRKHLARVGWTPSAEPAIGVQQTHEGGARVEGKPGVRGALVQLDPNHYVLTLQYGSDVVTVELRDRDRGLLTLPDGSEHSIDPAAYSAWGSATRPYDLYQTAQMLLHAEAGRNRR